MGGGSWTADSFVSYSTSKGRTTSKSATTGTVVLDSLYTNQDIFKQKQVHKTLSPKGNIMRECRDTEEHPNTVPVILALDVTGSMGSAATEVARQLSTIMEQLYKEVPDVEFLVMGIGDLYCDRGPIQISQFESDIRIAEHLDNIWFEFGGGGNFWESYTAAWYMASRHCDLDCWNRGKKGIIITMGDERLNPVLQKEPLNFLTDDSNQADIKTEDLYEEVTSKYDVFHIDVTHRHSINSIKYNAVAIRESFGLLGERFKEANIDEIPKTITEIIKSCAAERQTTLQSTANDKISW